MKKTMNKVIFLTISLPAVSFASDVKVTSFRFLQSGSHSSAAAEICGELINPTAKPEMVKITSDPGSKGPGQYYSWTGPEGKFCSVIATYTGKAEVDAVK